MTFWFVASGVLGLVVARLVWLALRTEAVVHARSAADYLQSQTILIARGLRTGEIATEHHTTLEAEAGRAALADSAFDDVANAPGTRAEKMLAAALIAVLLPAIALPVYLHLGNPSAAPPPINPHAGMTPTDMLAELQTRIEREPQNPEPRMWLARVYLSTGQYKEAVAAFAELYKLAPDEPAVLIQYADALAMTQDGKLNGQATTLIRRALELDPRNATALWLAGVAADQTGDPSRALAYLKRAKEATTGTEIPSEDLDRAIAEIEARSGVTPAAPDRSGAPVAGATITVDIQIDEKIRAQFAPDATVFVFAKAPNGPPAPLAVKRLTLAELPAAVVLDDSLAMAPQFKLSSATQVNVTARISHSGSATAVQGDIEGSVGPLVVGPATRATIVIKDVVP